MIADRPSPPPTAVTRLSGRRLALLALPALLLVPVAVIGGLAILGFELLVSRAPVRGPVLLVAGGLATSTLVFAALAAAPARADEMNVRARRLAAPSAVVFTLLAVAVFWLFPSGFGTGCAVLLLGTGAGWLLCARDLHRPAVDGGRPTFAEIAFPDPDGSDPALADPAPADPAAADPAAADPVATDPVDG